MSGWDIPSAHRIRLIRRYFEIFTLLLLLQAE